MNTCIYCGHPYGSWHTCKGTQAAIAKDEADYQRADRTSALAAVRSVDQSAALRAENLTLQTELATLRHDLSIADNEIDRLRTQINRDSKEAGRIIGAMGAEHLRNRGALIRERDTLAAELEHVRTALEVSQRALGHALECTEHAVRERNEWHRLAVESDREATVLREERDRAIYERDTYRAVTP